ncbi:MAG: DUF2207 domain-containing protein [Candidatus Promineifilaceae bacterium]|nr:DUF2207 domain-containing protein [Candidatus Promineifilaceae bacterium]
MKTFLNGKRLSLIPLFLLLLLLAPRPGEAQAKTYYWESFNVDVQVQTNGDLRVTERQTLVFAGAPFSYGFRKITTANMDGITDVSVREGDIVYQASSGGQHTFTVEDEGDAVAINWYFPQTTGRHSYTIAYTAQNAIRTEPSGDQVFWNALPGDLGARVENSTISITLPEGIEARTSTALFGGREGENMTTSVSEDGRRVTFQLTQPRPAGTAVEVGVRFPSGQLELETPAWQRREQINDAISLFVLVASLLIAVGGPLAALMLWYLFGRDPEVGPTPDYLTEPPDETPPAVVGTLVDETAHLHDIMSTLVDLARRGYLTMTETGRGKDYEFQRTDKPLEDLRPFERKMIEGIFSGREKRDLEDLRYKFASRLTQIRNELYKELKERGYVRRSPEGVRGSYGCLSFGIGGIAFLSFFSLPGIFGNGVSTIICPSLALGVTAVIMFVVSRYMPAKTAKGAEAAAQWMAFKKYLQEIERYTNLEEATEIFEKYLPYAVAFGLERSWIRKFSTVPNTPIPPWYVPYPVYRSGRGAHRHGGTEPVRGGTPASGSGGRPSLEGMSGSLTGGLTSMSGGLTRMLTNTQTVLQSTRSSSGSSGGGSFSGGFSGGSSGGGSGGFG